jgi:hypothetical protein
VATKVFNDPDVALNYSRIHRGFIPKGVVTIAVFSDGSSRITSSLEAEATINLLDKAMEAIDGQRLPPDAQNNGSRG